MDKVNGRLTVYFEEPFWVGIFEHIEDGKLSVAKVTFGVEPKDYEVQEYIQKYYFGLKFSPAVEAIVKDIKRNPKRMQRAAKKQILETGIGTKSQQALKLQHDQSKSEHILQNKKQKELDKMRLFALKQQKKKEKQESLLMAGTVAFSIVAAVAIFMVLPYFLSSLMKPVVPSYHLRTVIEGFVRIGIFIIYILLISRMEDIQRTFMYHGAEHKCINCVEHGLPLTVENVLKSSRLHKRCGTSFLFLVMLVSIVLHFMFVAVPFYWVRLLGRLLMVPVVAGISFEIIQWAGRTDSKFADIMSKPGLAMQKFTTKEPAADMAEVAIKAVEAVFDWRAYLKEEFDLDIPYETEETENADS